MMYGKLWKTMTVIFLLGALLISGGIFIDGINRITLIGMGTVLMISALTRRASLSCVAGLLAGESWDIFST
ncbi:MAG: hypothetical protein QGH39_04265 [Candidatus Thermoplasmatota archaeon]|jgi:hypothetical protein|nr:hypothetical protein [Candidatus Thermoplasmatota archaeon]MDP7264757.1 hypothetical protein [Candidatus Thermoplasmatota archaeon]